MKSPHNQRPDDQAREATEEFIAKHARTREAAKRAREAEEGRASAAKLAGQAP